MEELLSTIKYASEKLIKEHNVESIDIYVDEDVSENKRVRVSIDFTGSRKEDIKTAEDLYKVLEDIPEELATLDTLMDDLEEDLEEEEI